MAEGRRICALCKTSFPISDMVRAGRDYLCAERISCYQRRMQNGEVTTACPNTNSRLGIPSSTPMSRDIVTPLLNG